MGNICADLLEGAKMWEHRGDRRELLSVRFQKALRPGKNHRDQVGRLWAEARSPAGPGVAQEILTTPSSQTSPDGADPTEARRTSSLKGTRVERSPGFTSQECDYFFSASFLCCVTFMKSYTLHIFLICFLCKKKSKRTKRETTWSSQKPEDMLESWPTTD